MRLFLIRHPLPAVAPGTCYGATDLPLAEHPAALAAHLRTLLPDRLPLYSSPLQRCRLLAEQLHAQPRFDARLREIDFGDWEMQAWDALDRTLIDAWAADPFHFVPPGGEAVAALRARVRAFLDELQQDAVLVAHAGVIKVCAAELAGETDWFGLRFDYGSVTLFENGAWRAICVAQDTAARDKCHSPAAPLP